MGTSNIDSINVAILVLMECPFRGQISRKPNNGAGLRPELQAAKNRRISPQCPPFTGGTAPFRRSTRGIIPSFLCGKAVEFHGVATFSKAFYYYITLCRLCPALFAKKYGVTREKFRLRRIGFWGIILYGHPPGRREIIRRGGAGFGQEYQDIIDNPPRFGAYVHIRLFHERGLCT